MRFRIFKKNNKQDVKIEHSSDNLITSIIEVVKGLGFIFNCGNVLEIGSRDGNDANRIATYFKVEPSKVFIVEANPNCFKFIKKQFPKFDVLHKAVFNVELTLSFNNVFKENIGTSSLLDRNDNFYDDKSEKIFVDSIRADNYLNSKDIKTIGFCKIDVEGATLEVLESFGNRIADIQMLHLECEHVEIWKGQNLYGDIEKFLISNNFERAFFEFVGGVERQSDSIWINQSLLKLGSNAT